MNKILSCLCAFVLSSQVFASERIVSASAFATEAIYELSLENHLAGVDLTSTYPPQAKSLPQVGYKRTLATEGILSLKPTVLIVDSSSGPKSVIDAVRSSGVKVLEINEPKTIEEMKVEIIKIAKFFGASSAKAIVKIDDLTNKIKKNITKKKTSILFISRHGGNAEFAAGNKTIQQEVINMLGGINVVNYSGVKPLNAEAMLGLVPNYIIYATLETLSDDEKHRVVSKAIYKGKNIIFVQSIPLLSFGVASLHEILEISKQIQ